jgi:hypothetical protein
VLLRHDVRKTDGDAGGDLSGFHGVYVASAHVRRYRPAQAVPHGVMLSECDHPLVASRC